MEAAGLASSIITFIDFSYKLINGSIAIYQQAQGGSGTNLDTSKIVHDLQNITKAMSQTTPSQPKPHEQALCDLASHCNALSNELVALLKSLKPKSGGSEALRSLQASFKALRKAREIREIEQKLDSYKLQLLLRLNMMLCESSRAVGSQIEGMQSDHSEFSRKNIQELQSVKITVETLESKVLHLAEVIRSGNSSATTAEMEHSSSLHQIQLDLASLKELIAALPQQTPAHFRILDRLNFDRLHFRIDSVEDGQFHHALSHLKPNQSGFRPRAFDQARNAVELWSADGGNVLHISGKPGSGKSTLMKLLSQNEGLHGRLTTWAGEKKLVVASFFFWNAGSPLQKSIEGLYRAILFEVLGQCPDLTDHVFPPHTNQTSSYGQNASSATPYRPFELKNAMELLVQSFTEHSRHRLCLFIDGLDELDGKSHDYQQLAKQLRVWADNRCVRICASSRPYHEFHHVFNKITRIDLHELTRSDIYDFSHKTLMESNNGHLGLWQINHLAESVTNKAEGVFLWARFVARTLSEGILHNDTYKSLEAKVHHTPKDVNDLFLQLFRLISPEDRTRAYRLLLVLKEWPSKQTFNAIMVSWMDDLEDSDFPYNRPRTSYTDEQVKKCIQYAELQLKLVCKGLLELKESYSKKDVYFGHHIGFFHRTALDFLKQPETVSAMQQHLGNWTFAPSDYHLRLRLAEIKFARSSTAMGSSGAHELEEIFKGVCHSAKGLSRAVGECGKILQHYQEETHTTSTLSQEEREEAPYWGAESWTNMEEPKALSSRFYHLQDGEIACRAFSFLHHCAHIGASAEFILEQVAAEETRPPCPHLCLILSAVWCQDYCDPDLLGRLLGAGLRLSERILLRERTFGDETSQFVPGWVAFLAWLGNYSAQNWQQGRNKTRSQDERGAEGPFSVLELLLRQQRDLDSNVSVEFHRRKLVLDHPILFYEWAEPYLGDWKLGPEWKPFILTLEELILGVRPPNMDILLQELQARKSRAKQIRRLASQVGASANSGAVPQQRIFLPIQTERHPDADPKKACRPRRIFVGGNKYDLPPEPKLRIY